MSDLNYSGRSLEFLNELEILLIVKKFRVGKYLVCYELLRERMNLLHYKSIKRDYHYYRLLNFASHFICLGFSTERLILSVSKYSRYTFRGRNAQFSIEIEQEKGRVECL